jgi:rhodanese-related sulfurtransferase
MNDLIKDVCAAVVWDILSQNPSAQLIDVRTPEEWNNVGIPDISVLAKKPMLISWLKDLNGSMNENFIRDLESHVPNKKDMLVFICRSGVRSANAAKCAHSNGYEVCINVQDGFEGKNGVGGWKNSNLAHTVYNV